MDKVERLTLLFEAHKSGIQPEVVNLFVGYPFKNAEQTSDVNAAIGGSWKQYWKIFAREDFPRICPFCGESLDDDDLDGCHVNIGKTVHGNTVAYSRKKYIIPGHHACNMQLGDCFASKVAVKAIEAIEK